MEALKKGLGGLLLLVGTGYYAGAAALLLATVIPKVASLLGRQGSIWLCFVLCSCAASVGFVIFETGREMVVGPRDGTGLVRRLTNSTAMWMYGAGMAASFAAALAAMANGWSAAFRLSGITVLLIPLIVWARTFIREETVEFVPYKVYDDAPLQARVPATPASPLPLTAADKNSDLYVVLVAPEKPLAAPSIDELAARTALAAYDLKRALSPPGPARPLCAVDSEVNAGQLQARLIASGIPAGCYRRSDLYKHFNSAEEVQKMSVSLEKVVLITARGQSVELLPPRLTALWLGWEQTNRDPFLVICGRDGDPAYYVRADHFDWTSLPDLVGATTAAKLDVLAQALSRWSHAPVKRFFFERDVTLSTLPLIGEVGPLQAAILQSLPLDQRVETPYRG